ncbi:VanZ family protein [Kitasatospora sp. A2-31]|uniref:VanZ family protein n=1 Tax=Kitasatospora sp. A2-31 TaxID=2916414 RepID=UPI001EE9ADB0|nr:VanZ family protein [Kitasatospora sp. A2-31]MCG6492881.1 VanZ family protein [Kitasatospora sp. A2-31]
MLEVSLSAVPDLLPFFLVFALLLVPLARWQGGRRKLPPAATVLWALGGAGVLAVTLTPIAGAHPAPSCAYGPGAWQDALGPQGSLNAALFGVPAFFAVLALRRPFAVAAGAVVASAALETAQALLRTGRACDAADLLANAAGALLGVVLAAGWLALRRTGLRSPLLRDALGGLGLGAAGLAAVAVVLQIAVPVHRDLGARTSAAGAGSVPAGDGGLALASALTARLYGPRARVLTTSALPAPRFAVTTDAGSFRTDWPAGRLLSFTASPGAADGVPGPDGAVPVVPVGSEEQVAAGARFAAEWFADLTASVAPTVTPSGADGASRTLRYHRTGPDGAPQAPGVEITVDAAGRVTAATAVR